MFVCLHIYFTQRDHIGDSRYVLPDLALHSSSVSASNISHEITLKNPIAFYSIEAVKYSVASTFIKILTI